MPNLNIDINRITQHIMKKLILTTLFAAFGIISYGQTPPDATLPDKALHNALSGTKSGFERHDLRLTIGAFAILNGDYYYLGSRHDGVYYEGLSIRDNYRLGNQVTAGAYSFSYHYSPLRWLAVGAYLTFANVHQRSFNRLTGEAGPQYADNHLIFTPTLRFQYLNRPMVRIYSQIGAGIGRMRSKSTSFSGDQYTYQERYVTIHTTILGISVGRKLYGFAEFGASSIGCMNAGIGYRF